MGRRGLLLRRQEGRHFVVTGASSGLGFAAAQLLVEGGAHVTLAVRDLERGRRAAEGIDGPTDVRRLDVADLSSVREFAGSIAAFDVLINNAGVMGLPFGRSPDGFELQVATNYLGHHALTLTLLGQQKIRERIVVVASQAHRNARLQPADLNFERRRYDAYEAYANSKLATLLFMAEVQRRLSADGSTVRVMGAHPGYSATKLTESTKNPLFNGLAHIGNRLVGMRPRQGARSIVAAAVLDVPGNTYFGPDGPGQLWGEPTVVDRSPAALDPDLARELWRETERLTGVTLDSVTGTGDPL